MNQRIQQSIQNGLKFLAANQLPNGRFSSTASQDEYKYCAVQVNDSIFPTTLILNCLSDVSSAEYIKDKAAHYLLAQVGEQGTWNYWDRVSKQRPYPDDWDDTACAVSGILACDTELISPALCAKIAKSLLVCEVEVGGPYITWLVPVGSAQWQDVDVAVNANIGFMLDRLGSYSMPLEEFFDRVLASNNLKSPYYSGIVPTLYFLSRWYRGKERDALHQMILSQLESINSPLHTAMLITAAYNTDARYTAKNSHIRRLLEFQRHDDGWPAFTLYYEPPRKGKQRYAASPELTTAFILEALAKHIDSFEQKVVVNIIDDEINKIAIVFRRTLKAPIPMSLINRLNKASQLGWAVFTVYDDQLDQRSTAHHQGPHAKQIEAVRQAFKDALPQDQEFATYVDQVFAVMQRGYTWELQNARNIHKLPDYGTLRALADRSWGQVLAPVGVLCAAGYKLDSEAVRFVERFMLHYIIAKQLHDDARDWQVDFANGHASPVVTMLLKEQDDIDLRTLQERFWLHTMEEVNELIRHHVDRAKHYVESNAAIIMPKDLLGWLKRLEDACNQAEAARDDAIEFIQNFYTADLVQ